MRLRTILLGIGGVLVALIAAAIVMLLNIDFNQYKGLIVDRVQQETGRKLAIGGELKLKLFPLPAVNVRDVAFANADWGSRPQMAKLGELSGVVQILPLIFGGNVRVDRLVLKDVDLLLETDAKGRPNWDFGSSQPPPVASGGSAFELPSFGEVTLENIVVSFRDGATRKTTVFTLKALTSIGVSGGPMQVKATADYQGLPIEIAATVGALSSLLRPQTPYPVQAEIAAAGATVKLIGSAAEPVAGRGLSFSLTVDGKNLSTLGNLLGVDLPAKPFHVAANVAGDAGKALTFKGTQASFGASAATGEVGIALDGPRPKINANLSVATLDLTEFPTAKAPPSKRSRDQDRLFTDEPLPIEALRAMDADVTLSVGAIKTEKLTLQNLSLHLTLDDRSLQVKPFTVDLAGSSITGTAEISSRQAPAAVALDLNGKQLDIGKLLQQASGNDLLEGRGDVNIAVRGAGDSLHAIAASLSGQSSLVIGKGRIRSRYADLIGADVFREAFAWAKGKQDAALNCMVSRFDIQKGLATSRGILMDTSEVTILGDGTINLGSERLDLVLKPHPKEISLLNLATPIDITGTLKQPSITPDRTAMAKEVAVGVASMINPLVAIGSFLLDNSSSGDKNPCLAALEKSRAVGSAKPAPNKDEGGISGTVKGIGRSIDNLFK
jgi:uncharacterized protein involved in outer membrane biogenesis